MPDERLEGGNVSDGVVRVEGTVRRPTGPWTPAVHRLLRHLEQRGFDGAPRVYGIDGQGREVLEYIDGDVAWPDPHLRLLAQVEDVFRVGTMLRSFHDAVADFDPGPRAVWRFPEMEVDAARFADARGLIVCHNDPAAWNLVVGPDRWAFIDWDVAGPRPAIWDVAYCAVGVVPITPQSGEHEAEEIPMALRLRALCDGYGLERADRDEFPRVVVARIDSSYTHLRRRAEAGVEPWRQLWSDGHGDGWRSMLEFARQHAERWRRELAGK